MQQKGGSRKYIFTRERETDRETQEKNNTKRLPPLWDGRDKKKKKVASEFLI